MASPQTSVRPSGKRIFDCFIFYNEVELLKLRLHELFEHVDYFVICEANRTFRGDAKPLTFNDNKEMFGEFLDKIRVVVVDDMPSAASAWDREFHQRQALRRALTDVGQNDIVMISDADEIIRASTVDYLRRHDGYFMLDMPMYQFHFNMRALDRGWVKPFAYTWSMDADVGDYNAVRQRELATFRRFAGRHHRIIDAGWHFTFLGGAERIRQKLSAYSHDENWQQQMLQPGEAERQMILLQDVGAGRFLEFCAVDGTFPQYLQENLRQFEELGLIKDALSRIPELAGELGNATRRAAEAEARVRYLSAELERARSLHGVSTNLALDKPATQSSVSGWSHGTTRDDDASGATNGSLREPGHYGFHTEWELNPWWQVDLGQPFIIDEIRLHNRQGSTAYRLRHFTLLGSDDGVTWHEFHRKTDDAVFDGLPCVVHPAPGVQARFIRVRLDGEDFLHFDQCLVYGRTLADGPMSP